MWLVFFNLKYVILKPQPSFNGFVFYFTAAFMSPFSKVMGLTEKSFHVVTAVLFSLQIV